MCQALIGRVAKSERVLWARQPAPAHSQQASEAHRLRLARQFAAPSETLRSARALSQPDPGLLGSPEVHR